MPPVENPNAAPPPAADPAAEMAKLKAQFEQQIAERDQKLAQATAALAAIQAEPKPQQPQVDPSFAEQMNAWAEQNLKPVFGQLTQQLQQFRQFQYGNQLQQQAQQHQAPPEVQQRAAAIQQEQLAAGRHILPEVALQHAWGEIAMKQHQEALKAKAAQNQFNSAPPTYSGPGHLPAYTSNVAPPRASLNSEDWLKWGEMNDLPL